MKLNEFINKLIEFRDEFNAGEFNVCTDELVYDVMCGEVQDVYLEPVELTDEQIVFNKDNEYIRICAVDNKREY